MAYRSLMRSRFYRVVAVALAIALIASPLPLHAGSHLFGPVVAQAQASPPPPLAALPGDGDAALQQLLQAPLPGGLAALDGLGSSALMGQSAAELSLGTQLEESAAANPLSISRIQSAYRPADAISGTVVITFTVTNNLPPASIPTVPASATVTETVDALAAVDLAKDTNALHNVLLHDRLGDDVSFVSAYPLADRTASATGADLAWNLGTIAPLASMTAVVTVSVPIAGTAFVSLDAGASAWGTQRGQSAGITTGPALLAPDTIDAVATGSWLMPTPDADVSDVYMLQKAAELGHDPARMFEYARSLEYECYKGSLRGTRGTLWSEAGNSLDKASLLIAMLRASGIPARYRHGTLAPEHAQSLVLSMFPLATRLVGHVGPTSGQSDPAFDDKLLAEAQDHWWVEAYVPGQGWQDMDPSFETAALGQRIVVDTAVAADGTDRIAEVPQALRHQVTIRLKVEKYESMASLAGDLPTFYPLSATFSTAELAGKPVSLRHMVSTQAQGGLVFYTAQHTYVPYLSIENRVMQGQPYQDLISNFPFGYLLITGEWLVFEVRDVEGKVETLEREILDQVGFENRQPGGTALVGAGSGSDPAVSEVDDYAMVFAPGRVSRDTVMREAAGILTAAAALQQASQSLTEAQQSGATEAGEESPELREARNAICEAAGRQDYFCALYYCLLSDLATEDMAAVSQVKAYYDAPRIIIASTAVQKDAAHRVLDLRSNPIRSIAFPGQALFSQASFLSLRGIADTVAEHTVMEQITGSEPVSVIATLRHAEASGITMAAIDPFRLDDLAAMPISAEAKARITQAVREGWCALVPTEMVTYNGVTTTGWWQVNLTTGEVIGVGEDGFHGVGEYVANLTLADVVLIGGVGVVALTYLYTSLSRLGVSPALTSVRLGEWEKVSQLMTLIRLLTKQLAYSILSRMAAAIL